MIISSQIYLFKLLNFVNSIHLNIISVNIHTTWIYDIIILHYHTFINQINNKNMTTISVPLPPNMVEYIESEVKAGNYSNKAQLIRKAIAKFREDEAIEEILRSERDLKEGRVFYGDLIEISKKFNK